MPDNQAFTKNGKFTKRKNEQNVTFLASVHLLRVHPFLMTGTSSDHLEQILAQNRSRAGIRAVGRGATALSGLWIPSINLRIKGREGKVLRCYELLCRCHTDSVTNEGGSTTISETACHEKRFFISWQHDKFYRSWEKAPSRGERFLEANYDVMIPVWSVSLT